MVSNMFKIIKDTRISENEYDFWLDAPRIAHKAQAGQFIILRSDENGERIPLTIADVNREKGWIRLIFQVIGKTTADLATLHAGDTILDLTGPLGVPTEIKNYGTIMIVGGGVGIAAIFPIMKALKQAGNRVITILGAKSADLVILKDECAEYSDELMITTDDGSLGTKGRVTDAMEDVMNKETIHCSWAIGPSVMMKFCSLTAEKYAVPMYVSLNPIMIDGTGMCGGCRVTVADSIKFACVDGPEFKGNEVNWDEFINRMGQYKEEEKIGIENAQEVQVNQLG